MQNIQGQMRRVHGGICEASQLFHQLLAPYFSSFRERFSLDHFGEAGTGGDGGHAPAGAKTDLVNAPVGDFDGEIHDVTADGMLEASFRVGAGQVADVAGMFKMIENLLGVAHTFEPAS